GPAPRAAGSRGRSRTGARSTDVALVRRDVVGDHALAREARLDVLPNLERGERVRALERPGHVAVGVDDDPRAAVLDQLRPRTVGGAHPGRASGHALDHHQPEGLLPLDREERRTRILEQLDLLAVRRLAEVLDPVVAEVRLDERLEVLDLLRVALLAGDQ